MSQNSPTSEVSGQKQWDRFLGHPCAWSLRMIGEIRFVSEKRSILLHDIFGNCGGQASSATTISYGWTERSGGP